MIRLLIDECLSAKLAAVAKERGVAADFGPHVGIAGWQDWSIVRFAFENDYVVVTNNRRDFLRHYARLPVHGGLVIIVPNVERDAQIDLFVRVLESLAGMSELPINKLLEIVEDGRIFIRDWSAGEHDVDHVRSPDWQAR